MVRVSVRLGTSLTLILPYRNINPNPMPNSDLYPKPFRNSHSRFPISHNPIPVLVTSNISGIQSEDYIAKCTPHAKFGKTCLSELVLQGTLNKDCCGLCIAKCKHRIAIQAEQALYNHNFILKVLY